jgi:outer membrane protein assembly factor BamB
MRTGSVRLVVLLAAVALLGGCKWFKSPGKDNVDPPTELTDITTTLSVQKLWSRNLGDGAGRTGVRLAPAFADGRVFASDIDGGVYAIDADSGNVVWQTKVERIASSSPGVGDGVVVVGTLDGDVIALEADSGNERWKFEASSEVIARPLVRNGIVVVRSNDGRLYGIDAGDGSRKWVFDRGVPLLSLRGNGAPVAGDDALYIGYDNGKVLSIGLADGAVRWEQTLSEVQGRTELERINDVDGELHLDAGELYAVGFHGQVGALSLDGGRLLWSRDMSAYAGVSLSRDKLFVADIDGNVWALDARSGTSVWKQEGLAHRWLSTPEAVDGHVVVGDLEGYVHWLDAETGKFAARTKLGDKGIRAAPLVVGNTVYISDSEGDLAAYRIGGAG